MEVQRHAQDTHLRPTPRRGRGHRVSLAGWVHRRRDHGGLVFVDLRDRWGITQVVFNPDMDPQAHAPSACATSTSCASRGRCTSAPGLANPNLPTGEIEVVADDVEILNEARRRCST